MAINPLSELYDKQVKALNTALVKAQAEFPPITKDRTVTVETKAGGRYTYSYAPLDSILAAVRPVLAKHGLALVQLIEDTGQGTGLRTELRHAEGGQLSGSFQLPQVPAEPQALGSLLTYLRRYALTAILGIATETDDDGQAGKGKPGRKPKPEPKPQFQPPTPAPEPAAEAPDPELAPLVAEVQHQFETLRKLEADLEIPQRRDWTQWVRRELGLGAEAMGTPEDYRRAVELLGKEQTRLIAELARKTAQGG